MPDPPKITIDTSVANVDSSSVPIIAPDESPIELTHDDSPSIGGPPASGSHDFVKEAQSNLQAAQKSTSSTFSISQEELNCLIDPNDPYVLRELGGISKLAQIFQTDLSHGLTTDTIERTRQDRVASYGENRLPERKAKSLLQLMWIAMKDKVLIILSIAAIVSLALGLYETFGQPAERDAEGRVIPKVEWVEGVAIIVAVLIVVVVGAGNDWQKERQFVKLNKKKEDRKVKVMRNGAPCEISIYDVVVGDLMMLEPGDMIPADGILVMGHDVKCDESSATGESHTLTKKEAHTVLSLLDAADDSNDPLNPADKRLDCFMLSGSKVIGGTGHFLVTAVGTHSLYGRTMMSLNDDPEATPLQEKLNSMAESIAKVGIAAAVVLFIALFIRFCVQLNGSPLPPAQKGNNFLDIFITSVTIVVVAVPEGLPLAVTLALAFATTRMVKDNNLVRVLKSCETMGGATTVCSDKTGTLTQNKMTIVAGQVGGSAFEIDPDRAHDNEDAPYADESTTDLQCGRTNTTPAQVLSKLPERMSKLLFDSIAINSSAFESTDNENEERFVGSKTETALLNFAVNHMGLDNLEAYRESKPAVQVYPFDSAKKFMSTVIANDDTADEGYLVLVKGASEVVMKRCSKIYDMEKDEVRPMTPADTERLLSQIDAYASRSLRTIGLVYREIPEHHLPNHQDQAAREKELFHDFVFLSVVGIMDPLRPGVKQAVQDCKDAGVVVRMVTGDNIHTARAIALDCGILSGPNDKAIVMEGPKFRKLDPLEMRHVAPKLRVLARSSPDDKRKLVKVLKSLGETVAVTGDGTNDAPALKLADVGFSMGIAGTEVAKEASEIILMDDNFGSIVKAIMWGRTVNDAVKKFLQFQLTVNVTAVLLTFVSAVASSQNKSVLTAVQLLWVNLIMDTFAALALATDPPSPSVLHRKPDSRQDHLISVEMWKMILGQAVLQLVITFILHFGGYSIFHAGSKDLDKHTQLDAMVFNTFVWLQFFNIFVNRRLDNNPNIFEGIFRNKLFLLIVAIIGGGQVLIMFVGGAAFSVKRQTGVEWAVAIVCGMLSIPASVVIRLIPNRWVVALVPRPLVRFLRRSLRIGRPKVTVEDEEADIGAGSIADPSRYRWNPAIEQVREQLQFIKRVKGGRLSNLKFRPRKMYETWKEALSPGGSTTSVNDTASSTMYSPTTTTMGSPMLGGDTNAPAIPHSEVDEHGFLAVPSTPTGRTRGYSSGSSTIAPLTMIPGIIGGAIAGWSPTQHYPPSDNFNSRDET
ncbi:calcium-transporting ATPase 2 [Trichomonascus vanleenenianus]|uniref:calcium-transporting ATPase PMC1 n=1 Tax=Trichomonascus vanleenenianus TaxID=2268995 RepID=UPI003EC98A4E